MNSLNPFKIISNIENESLEFEKMAVKDAVGAAIIYGIILCLIGGFTRVFSINNKSQLEMFMLNTIMALMILAATTIIFYKLYIIRSDKDLFLKEVYKKFTIRNIFYATVAIVGFRIISNNLVIFVLDPFSKILMPKSMLKSIGEIIQMPFIIYVCIVGPAMEEFVFRGVILGGLLKKYSGKNSIIVSALLFGIVHLNGIQFINGFLLGVLLGYVYVKTKSIYLCMYSHMLFNSIAFVLAYVPYMNRTQNLFVVISLTILGVVFIIYGLKKVSKCKDLDKVPRI
ncbi:CAAX amino terminal protease self- immunity [Clostridium ragsdalei P11]|uniref:CAAX amino terminal protease self-immunity n=1 Tax=Clostridium ragsdalei P11 TaxID=1353534 RepID=A0A1A6B2K3_9CLOT|nr:type II CAAX endopeptidase family protein [Clostridium ragsdalei]OBR96510.1 CAAX amino terminal protease self- immunity [Clostridium ragsdalei P11]